MMSFCCPFDSSFSFSFVLELLELLELFELFELELLVLLALNLLALVMALLFSVKVVVLVWLV